MRESRNVDLRPIYGILLLLHEKFDTLPVGTSCNKKIMQNFASSHIYIRRSVRFDFYVLLLMISPYLFLAVSHGTRRKRGGVKWHRDCYWRVSLENIIVNGKKLQFN